MKTKLSILCVFLLVATSSFSQNSKQLTYEIEVAAFNTEVSMDYFGGMTGITYYKDANDIHRYRIKNIATLTAANTKIEEAKSKGFNARLIDILKERALYSQCQEKLDHLFFDFDKATLNTESMGRLNELAMTLKRNPDLKVVLEGHTDAKGSDDYNTALSQERTQKAMAYLLRQEVNPLQISTEFFGEKLPIAKNLENNQNDLPQGRKYNRRVEIQIVNTSSKKPINGLVKKIKVPNNLKY